MVSCVATKLAIPPERKIVHKSRDPSYGKGVVNSNISLNRDAGCKRISAVRKPHKVGLSGS